MARRYFTPMYLDYMRSELWAWRRRQCLVRFGHRCAACGTNKSLQVHHLTYVRFTRELPTDLVVLCKRCHEVADHVRRMTR